MEALGPTHGLGTCTWWQCGATKMSPVLSICRKNYAVVSTRRATRQKYFYHVVQLYINAVMDAGACISKHPANVPAQVMAHPGPCLAALLHKHGVHVGMTLSGSWLMGLMATRVGARGVSESFDSRGSSGGALLAL